MKILVTGVAGFIGSHLSENLLKDPQNEVIGVDTFTGPTSDDLKQWNLKNLQKNSRFQFHHVDLLMTDLKKLFLDIDVVYHLAGMPGVRSSWGKDFDPYVTNNIKVTQRLLEAAMKGNLKKFIYASTSSVYGEKSGRISEDTCPTPLSPYGITKLTGEHLCHVYHQSYQVPIIIVRFFTVYGPRQRPDMAFHRFITQILKEEPITVFGDGTQSRDFTFIKDCVDGTSSILYTDLTIGKTINIGGRERATVNEVIAIIEQLTGKKARIHYTKKISGEPKSTWADISLAQFLLDYEPSVTLREGLLKEIEYIRNVYQI